MSASYDNSRKGDPVAIETHKRNAEIKQSSDALKARLLAYFSKWERENGFKAGAGIKLLPSGWRE